MARVEKCEVLAIRPTDADIDPFINAASLVVDRLANSPCGSGLSDAELLNVELFLTAHLISSVDPTLTEEKFEGASNKYMVGSDTISGLLSDKYGQQANLLSGGCLMKLEQQKTVVNFL